ncbi:MAG TPA: hypothetical protein VK843_05365 [Planctomycetota bacterium]|nr:hypothetical protein [Planctomycetota bacterium]
MHHRFVRSRVGAPLLGLVALASPLAAQVVEFTIPTANSRPYTICAGPDGNLWFTESTGNKIGRITPAGVITEFPVLTPGSGPYGITVGADGNIWFTERFANQVAVLDLTTFQITEYVIPTWDTQPWKIAAGADGLLWFTEENMDQIGNCTLSGFITDFDNANNGVGCCFQTGIAAGPTGKLWYTIEIGDQIGEIFPNNIFTQHQIQSVQVLPWDIAPGSDGNMWFTELSGRAIGQITPAGVITEFPIPGQFSGIAGIATGSDGNLYFTENDTHQVSGMDLGGNVFQTFATSDRPLSICNGPDGNLWFTIADGNKIGRWTIAPAFSTHVLSMDTGFVPTVRTSQPGQTVHWSFNGPNLHAVSDISGMGLYASGPKDCASSFSYTYNAAGAYVYKDISLAYKRAAIDVRPQGPAQGFVGFVFQISWAFPAMPAGFIEDLIVLTPGASSYVPWMSSTSAAANYLPTVPGTYQFRARMRNIATGRFCAYSRPAVVVVN